MGNDEIVLKWEQGLTKYQIAREYTLKYNNRKKMRREVEDKKGDIKLEYITEVEALKEVERVIYRRIMLKKENF